MHTRPVVGGLFGEHGIRRAFAGEAVEDQGVGPLVPFVAEVVRVPETVALAHPKQQFTGLAGQLGGQLGIGETHHSSIAE